MEKVSVIVPVYQVEKYLSQCIESILSQTFSNLELILVDDGSLDESGKICDNYSRCDTRVKVIHKKNGGLSDARNRGIIAAEGNYIMFVDSDDYIASNMIELLYEKLKRENADIAVCNIEYYWEDDANKNFSTNLKSEIVSARDIYIYKKNERNYGVWTIACNKLYKRIIFDHIFFRYGKYHEDEYFANDIYQLNLKIVTIPQPLYYYRQRSDSITKSKKNATKNLDIAEAYRERIYVYLEKNFSTDQAYKVLIYELELLTQCTKIPMSRVEKIRFLKEVAMVRNIAQILKRSKLGYMKYASLIGIQLNPCLTFKVAMKFYKVLKEKL